MGGPGSGRGGLTPQRPEQFMVPFEGTEFVGWISMVSPTKTGVRLQVNVRWEDRDLVKTLWDAMGMPVVVKMERWAEYDDALEDADD